MEIKKVAIGITAFSMFVCAVPVSTQAAKVKLDADNALVPIEVETYKTFYWYRGIIHREDGDYAGYVSLVGSSDKAYRVSSSGKGKLGDIYMDAADILYTFYILGD